MKTTYIFRNHAFIQALKNMTPYGKNFALNQQSKADFLDVSRTTIMRIELGERPPTMEEFLNFCNASGRAPYDFFQIEEKK